MMNYNKLVGGQTIIEVFEQGMDREVPEIVPFSPIFHMRDGQWLRQFPILNVGCGNKRFDGTIGLDFPAWDAESGLPLPFETDTLGGIIAYHFLEHCSDPIRILREFERVLAPGCPANIVVPYYNSQMQAHDLTHKHGFCEETWRVLFKTPYYDKNREAPWRFKVGTNLIIGVVERNLALLTQLIKT